jgi:hypothetical protein
VIQGNFTHGMQVFIKAEIENHAGLKSVLRSKVLIIDHTAPLIQNIHGFIKYLSTENQTMISFIPLSRSIAGTQIDTVSGDICCAIISPVPFLPIVNLEHFDILAIILV